MIDSYKFTGRTVPVVARVQSCCTPAPTTTTTAKDTPLMPPDISGSPQVVHAPYGRFDLIFGAKKANLPSYELKKNET
jgi:hypothetical protein